MHNQTAALLAALLGLASAAGPAQSAPVESPSAAALAPWAPPREARGPADAAPLRWLFDGEPSRGGATFRIISVAEPPGAAQGTLVTQPPAAAPSAGAGTRVPAPRGTVVLIMIDGLGHKYLLEAMASGHAPNLASLIAEEGYRLAPYLNGLPTVTLAVQGQVFYGRRRPGNEWYRKSEARELDANQAEMEWRREDGLLYGGRAYLSELSGGAEAGAAVNRLRQEAIEKDGTVIATLKDLAAGAPLLLRYIWNHGPITEGPALVYRFLRDAWKFRRDFAERGNDTPLDRKAAFFMPFISHFLASIALEGVKRSVAEGVPVVFTDLASYDEEAHYYGPASAEAWHALESIDAKIGEAAAVARAHGSPLVVFSDHGQTPAVNFRKKFGKPFQQALDELVREARPQAKDRELVFSHVYSMGKIDVAGAPGTLSRVEVEAAYPGLLAKLRDHPALGLVAAREADGGIRLLGKTGTAALSAEGRLTPGEGLDPLLPYADERAPREVLARHIRNYLDMDESGDLVVFGAYEDGAVVDLNVKYTLASQHGGMGGEQMHPFILYKPGVLRLEPESILDATGLHPALRELVGR